MRPWAPPSLADANIFFESVREELLHGATPRGTLALVLAFATLVALIVVLSRIFRAPESVAAPPRRDMLREASDVLNLAAGERRDLLQLSRRCGATHPAALLLSPANLGHAVRLADAARPDPRLRARLNHLCERLHGEPLPGE
jgi:hypothetical protein